MVKVKKLRKRKLPLIISLTNSLTSFIVSTMMSAHAKKIERSQNKTIMRKGKRKVQKEIFLWRNQITKKQEANK